MDGAGEQGEDDRTLPMLLELSCLGEGDAPGAWAAAGGADDETGSPPGTDAAALGAADEVLMGNFTRRKFGCEFCIFCGFPEIFCSPQISAKVMYCFQAGIRISANLRNICTTKAQKTSEKVGARNFLGADMAHPASPWLASWGCGAWSEPGRGG